MLSIFLLVIDGQRAAGVRQEEERHFFAAAHPSLSPAFKRKVRTQPYRRFRGPWIYPLLGGAKSV